MTRRARQPHHDWRRIRVPLVWAFGIIAGGVLGFLWLTSTFVEARTFLAYQGSVERRIVESDMRKLNVELIRLKALCGYRPTPRCKPEDRAVLEQLEKDERALREQLNKLNQVK